MVRFNEDFQRLLNWYESLAFRVHASAPASPPPSCSAPSPCSSSVLFPFLGRAYFPRTDPGQFIINVRMPAGSRLEVSNDYIAQVENIIRGVVKPKDLDMIVSNIGAYPDLSAIYTPNASMDTAFVQTSLKQDHSVGSYEYMRRVQAKLSRQMPELIHLLPGRRPGRRRHQPGPARAHRHPDQIAGHGKSYALAQDLAAKIRALPGVSNTYIPQNLDYPGLRLDIDRERASLVGLTAKEVVDDVITALTSSGMVAPSYWIDPHTGNNYMVTVQYANRWINHMSMEDLENIPLHGKRTARLHPRGGSPPGRPCSRGAAPPATTRRRGHPRLRGRHQPDQHSHRGRSLPDPPRHRYLRGHQN